MWLVNTKDTSLERFLESELPSYAILSHTWGQDEVSFQDMQSIFRKPKQGWDKIKSACNQARKDDLAYLWADTCCIDKTSSAELQEAINSMFRWYAQAAVCYVYLSDVQCPVMTDAWAKLQVPGEDREIRVTGTKLQRWKQVFAQSRWFTRGWTLQELIAPTDCTFYNVDWNVIGTKRRLIRTISQITRVEQSVLSHDIHLSSISVAKRMSWAARRQTSRVEDMAYSLLGIFDVNIPMLYGEGTKAFLRLQEEIIKNSTDHSIFAWESTHSRHTGNLLAESPANFANADRIIQFGQSEPFDITNRGLRIALQSQAMPTMKPGRHQTWAALNCRFDNDISGVIALRLTMYSEGDGYHTIRRDDNHSKKALTIQPWDMDSTAKLGHDSRLAFIKIEHLIPSIRLPMNITKTYEPRHSPVVFTVETGEDTGETLEVYPQHLWSADEGFVNTIKQPSMRAGMLISRSSDECWVITFGFDQDDRPKDDDLMPHLSAQAHTGTHTVQAICESSRSHAVPDRTDQTVLVARARSAGQPGELVVSMHRSEIMGTIVYTVRVDFSGRFPELDGLESQRVYLELDAVETQRTAVETQPIAPVTAHQRTINMALAERSTTLEAYVSRAAELQKLVPLSGAGVKLWITFHDRSLKVRDVHPREGLHMVEGIVAYSSTEKKAVTLGLLVESRDGTLYDVFVYHGYPQSSHMPVASPSWAMASAIEGSSQPRHLGDVVLSGEDVAHEDGSRFGEMSPTDKSADPDKNLEPDQKIEPAETSSPTESQKSTQTIVPGELIEPEKVGMRIGPIASIARQGSKGSRRRRRSFPAATIQPSELGSVNRLWHRFADETFTMEPNAVSGDAFLAGISFGGTQVSKAGPSQVSGSEIAGVSAWVHDDQESLREMTEAIENCNRGLGLCGNAYHDRSSHPYTFAEVVLDARERLRVNMKQYKDDGHDHILVDVSISASDSRGNPSKINGETAAELAGSDENALDSLQTPATEAEVPDIRADPNTNFPDRGTDYSTLSGLRTGVDSDVLGTDERSPL